jgi:hypothetical protein
MNRGLKDKGVTILASIYNVSRMSAESKDRLERADLIYTNDRGQMKAVRAWADRHLSAGVAAKQHVITNTVNAFFSRAFTSKDGLPSSLRALYTAAGCEMGGPEAAHLMPDTLTLPDLSSDATTIARCDVWFANHGMHLLNPIVIPIGKW